MLPHLGVPHHVVRLGRQLGHNSQWSFRELPPQYFSEGHYPQTVLGNHSNETDSIIITLRYSCSLAPGFNDSVSITLGTQAKLANSTPKDEVASWGTTIRCGLAFQRQRETITRLP